MGETLAACTSPCAAKVIATASTIAEALYLKSQPFVSTVIDLSDRTANLVDSCLAVTGGLGVDCVLDSGVLGTSEDAARHG